MQQTAHLRGTYRNHAVGCPDEYDHPGGCRPAYPYMPTQYYSRLSYQASGRLNRRPIHIHQPDDQQPYSADWLMYCGREIIHWRLITQERHFAARDWADIPFCQDCLSKAPEESSRYA